MTLMSLALGGTSDRSSTAKSMANQHFGEYLRRELQARNWSVRYLGFRSGVDHSTISRLIRGERTPRLETVQRLHQALTPSRLAPSLTPARERFDDDPVKRVADALALDPQLTPAGVQEVLRHYVLVRRARRVPPATDPGPATSIRRVAGGRQNDVEFR